MFKPLFCCALLFPVMASAQFRDQYLSTGSEYRSDYVGTPYNHTHQFFMSPNWTEGKITYAGRTFTCNIRYDILVDKLIVQCIYNDSTIQIEPPRDNVTQFIIYDKTFVGFNSHFYEKRGDTLIHHAKSILPDQPVDGSIYSLIDDKKDRWFLLQNGALRKIKAPRR